MTAIALTIAGSEASAAPAPKPDLKTFHTLGVYGCTAPTPSSPWTLRTGWNHRFVPVDPGVIADQTRPAPPSTSRIDAVKIGMLGTAPTIDVVEQALRPTTSHRGARPWSSSARARSSGRPRVDNALRTKILPRATMTTPNLFEAATLAGMEEITRRVAQGRRQAHPRPGRPNVLAPPIAGTGTALTSSTTAPP